MKEREREREGKRKRGKERERERKKRDNVREKKKTDRNTYSVVSLHSIVDTFIRKLTLQTYSQTNYKQTD